MPPFIVTLAGMFLARGLCYLISIDSIAISDATLTALVAGAHAGRAAAARSRRGALVALRGAAAGGLAGARHAASAARSTRSAATNARRC